VTARIVHHSIDPQNTPNTSQKAAEEADQIFVGDHEIGNESNPEARDRAEDRVGGGGADAGQGTLQAAKGKSAPDAQHRDGTERRGQGKARNDATHVSDVRYQQCHILDGLTLSPLHCFRRCRQARPVPPIRNSCPGVATSR
jgi:hypothetical protein